MTCSICHCETLHGAYVSCVHGHAICGACLPVWADNLSLVDLEGKCCSVGVRCPIVDVDQCQSMIQYQDIANVCKDGDVVQHLAQKTEQAFRDFVEEGMSSTLLRCPDPLCKTLASDSHEMYATQYCMSCYQVFCACCHYCPFTSDPLQSRRPVHIHVPIVHKYESVFLPRAEVGAGQRRLRMIQLRDFLGEVKCEPVVAAFFESAHQQLTDLDLPTNWADLALASDAAKTILDKHRANSYIPDDNEEMPTPEELLGKEMLAYMFEGAYHWSAMLSQESLSARPRKAWAPDWFKRNALGNNVLNIAVRYGRLLSVSDQMTHVIVNGGGVLINELDCDGYTALHRFVFLNNLRGIKYLLWRPETDVESKTADGRTALFLCAESRQIYFAELLLKKGADLHCTNSAGQGVLMALSLRSRLDAFAPGQLVRNLNFWIRAGVNLEQPDGQGDCVLHYAASGRFDPGSVAVSTLLKGGAQVACKNRAGQSALQVAVHCGNLDAVRALVAAEGADPTIPFDSVEPLSLDEGQETRRAEITTTLKEAQAEAQRKTARAERLHREYGQFVANWLLFVESLF